MLCQSPWPGASAYRRESTCCWLPLRECRRPWIATSEIYQRWPRRTAHVRPRAFEGDQETQLWQVAQAGSDSAGRGGARDAAQSFGAAEEGVRFHSGLVATGQHQGIQVSTAAHAGNGIVYALLTAAGGGTEKLVPAVERPQGLAAACGGFLLVQRAPEEVVRAVPLWPPRSDYRLMQRIKSEMDPNNLWSPARTPGGRA